jgi:hypothetical protein
MDAKVPGSNLGISQGWDYWQSPVNSLLGGQNKGLMQKTASTTLMGIALGLPCFKLAVWEELDSGASWDWSIAPPGYWMKQARNLQRHP